MLKKVLKRGRQKLGLIQREFLREQHQLKWLLWECSLNCNFSCKHCESDSSRNISSELVTAKEIKAAFFDVAKNFQANQIMIGVTGGEPLLRKDLFEVMNYASELGFNWGLVSNGSLVTEKIVQKSREANMKTLDISIDGIGRVHDEFRNIPKAYEGAINAVKLFLKADFLLLVRIVTTVHAQNIDHLEKMYQTFCDLGITHWKLSNVDPSGRANENPEIFLNKEQMVCLLNFVKVKRSANSKLKITLGCAHYFGDEFEEAVRDRSFVCKTGINIGSILHNGDIFVCPNVPRAKHLIQGNIKHDSFSDMWKSKFKLYRDKNRTSCESCQKCDKWENCLGGAFHTWDFDKKEPRVCFLRDDFLPKVDS